VSVTAVIAGFLLVVSGQRADAAVRTPQDVASRIVDGIQLEHTAPPGDWQPPVAQGRETVDLPVLPTLSGEESPDSRSALTVFRGEELQERRVSAEADLAATGLESEAPGPVVTGPQRTEAQGTALQPGPELLPTELPVLPRETGRPEHAVSARGPVSGRAVRSSPLPGNSLRSGAENPTPVARSPENLAVEVLPVPAPLAPETSSPTPAGDPAGNVVVEVLPPPPPSVALPPDQVLPGSSSPVTPGPSNGLGAGSPTGEPLAGKTPDTAPGGAHQVETVPLPVLPPVPTTPERAGKAPPWESPGGQSTDPVQPSPPTETDPAAAPAPELPVLPAEELAQDRGRQPATQSRDRRTQGTAPVAPEPVPLVVETLPVLPPVVSMAPEASARPSAPATTGAPPLSPGAQPLPGRSPAPGSDAVIGRLPLPGESAAGSPAGEPLNTTYKGIDMRLLADAFTGIESGDERYRALGTYGCDGDGNCGVALGRYQFMSYHGKVVAIVAPQPGGRDLLDRLGRGDKITSDELLKYLPEKEQDRIFVEAQREAIDQAMGEIDPDTNRLFSGLGLVARIGEIHFGGPGAPIHGSASDWHGRLTLRTYGQELAASYEKLSRTGRKEAPEAWSPVGFDFQSEAMARAMW
jgi:hypothetical protein